ncbi:alpha/beta hydrolase [Kangiella profundi]|uniref:Alpha/beta hydrolase n=1 Tax=Kangiella profundi TaxID=1561924 RepID=A0A2K9AKS2_9GAMM|nr:alpha/beta fold hydrolase [Kangiella profundi]AUD79544.1 alpha/beta hydrolase [Kangiella profundi]GGE97579.1 alpha/beta hydrolase [Kangiella profundi]
MTQNQDSNNQNISQAVFIFAHGAGADSSSEFMQSMAKLISHPDIEVVLFDFPYMLKRQQTGKKSPPDRMPKLLEAYKQQILELGKGRKIFIGGKSMGGRVASMIADDEQVSGLICMGYPFHPPGKPDKLRTEHLQSLRTPTLILQGTRDPFGKPDEVASYDLSPTIKVQWLENGNHSLETLKRSEISTEESWQIAAKFAQDFILNQL